MDKFLLRGIAIGIIFSTIIYGYFYYNAGTKTEISQQQVDRFLEQNGDVKISKERYAELLTMEDKAAKETDKQPRATLPEPPVEEKKVEIEEVTFELTIEPGMTSDQISQILQQNQIIKDAPSFNQFLINNGRNTSIQIGTFTLSNQMTFDEIANIISN